jgi:hypothetical protein
LRKDLEFAEDTDFSLTLSESNFATRKNHHVDHPSSPTNPRSLNQVPPQARIPNMIPPANQGENFSPEHKPNSPTPKKERKRVPTTYLQTGFCVRPSQKLRFQALHFTKALKNKTEPILQAIHKEKIK